MLAEIEDVPLILNWSQIERSVVDRSSNIGGVVEIDFGLVDAFQAPHDVHHRILTLSLLPELSADDFDAARDVVVREEVLLEF